MCCVFQCEIIQVYYGMFQCEVIQVCCVFQCEMSQVSVVVLFVIHVMSFRFCEHRCVCCFSVDRNKYQIHIPLPPKIDPTVTMMQVEEKPDVTYSDVGGCKEQIEKLREVVETPLLHVSPEAFPCICYL